MVRKSILNKIKKFAIPFTTVSTASLLFNLKSVHAATFLERGDVRNGYFSKEAIEERGGSFNEFKELFGNIDELTGKIVAGLDWLNNLPVSLPKLTADLLTSIYNLLAKLALQTPLFIFNNPYIQNTSLMFAMASISIVTILTIYEAFMQMLKKEHTDFKTIVKRYFLVASVSGFLPFFFESGFTFINKVSHAISALGQVNGGNLSGYVTGEKMGFFDTLIIVLFDLTAISMLIPFALQQGKRWFDTLCLSAISPLALTSYVFDRHRHYFSKWWNSVKSLAIIQVVYAVFILMMGIFIFATQGLTGGIITLAIKLLIVLGGLQRLCNAPMFIMRMADGHGEDVFDMWDGFKKSYKNIYDTVTLKNLRPATFIREKLMEQKEQKKADLLKLRKQHKRRFIG